MIDTSTTRELAENPPRLTSRLNDETYLHLARLRLDRGSWVSYVTADMILNQSKTYSHKDYPVKASIGVLGVPEYYAIELVAKVDQGAHEVLCSSLPDGASISPYQSDSSTSLQTDHNMGRGMLDVALPIIYGRDDAAIHAMGGVLMNFTNMMAFYLPK
jgi:hypothetical protein